MLNIYRYQGKIGPLVITFRQQHSGVIIPIGSAAGLPGFKLQPYHLRCDLLSYLTSLSLVSLVHKKTTYFIRDCMRLSTQMFSHY